MRARSLQYKDLWTIQKVETWEGLVASGVLRGRPDLVCEDFKPAYAWMVTQMKQRIGRPPRGVKTPIWSWDQYRDAQRRRPDLRSLRHLAPGAPGVRIHFRVSPTDVLLSDFELWHFPLNYWHLSESLDEGDAFEAELQARGLNFYEDKPLADPHYHQRIQKGWERIFDLDGYDEDVYRPREKKRIQATVWELRMDQVLEVRHFTQRYRRPPGR